MDDLANRLQAFFDYEERIGYQEKVYISVNSMPQPTMLPNGKWQIPGTLKEFDNQQTAWDALKRFEKYNKEDMAALLIYGESYGKMMGGDPDREMPPLVQTSNGKFKFVDGKREYQSEEAAINAFKGFQKHLQKTTQE